jgi:hypothetical protein
MPPENGNFRLTGDGTFMFKPVTDGQDALWRGEVCDDTLYMQLPSIGGSMALAVA